jgi:hypothetical protein
MYRLRHSVSSFKASTTSVLAHAITASDSGPAACHGLEAQNTPVAGSLGRTDEEDDGVTARMSLLIDSSRRGSD